MRLLSLLRLSTVGRRSGHNQRRSYRRPSDAERLLAVVALLGVLLAMFGVPYYVFTLYQRRIIKEWVFTLVSVLWLPLLFFVPGLIYSRTSAGRGVFAFRKMRGLLNKFFPGYNFGGAGSVWAKRAGWELWCARTGKDMAGYKEWLDERYDFTSDAHYTLGDPSTESLAYQIWLDKVGEPFRWGDPDHYVVPYAELSTYAVAMKEAEAEKKWIMAWRNKLHWRKIRRAYGRNLEQPPLFYSDFTNYEFEVQRNPLPEDRLRVLFDGMRQDDAYRVQEKTITDPDELRLFRRRHWFELCDRYGGTPGAIARVGFLDKFPAKRIQIDVLDTEDIRLHVGRVVADEAAYVFYHTNQRFAEFCERCLIRHAHGDWGDVTDEERAWNNSFLSDGSNRIQSAYRVPSEISGCGTILEITTEGDGCITLLSSPLAKSDIEALYNQ